MGGFWANAWNITKFIYLFIYTLFHELTYRSDPSTDFTLYGSNDADSRKGVPFLGFVNTAPNFWGVNRCFQAKLAKILTVSCYRKYCINFNQILHNDRDHQVVILGGQNKRPTNPRWTRPLFKKKPFNRHISATVWPILMKFGKLAPIGPVQRLFKPLQCKPRWRANTNTLISTKRQSR